MTDSNEILKIVVTEGNNIWAKLKPASHLPKPAEQWAAMLIGKNRYVKFTENFVGGVG